MKDGFIRAGTATPQIKVADCQYNHDQILKLMRQADQDQVHVLIFPELCLTGYTCGDLFLSSTLLKAARKALQSLVNKSSKMETLFAVGLPLADGAGLYNVAAVFQQGRLLAFVPKLNLPNYSEFYEQRHFTAGPLSGKVLFDQEWVPFGSRLLFQCEQMPELTAAFEICEDLWVASPVSSVHAAAGATLIGNLSASDETVSKADYRRLLVKSQSARLICAYLYADAGEGESTTDLVFAGHNLIYENGREAAQSSLFSSGLLTADLDLQLLIQERRRQNTFTAAGPETGLQPYQTLPFKLTMKTVKLNRRIDPQPFVPSDYDERNSRCEEILQIQTRGLKKRLQHIGCRTAVVGLSGGLDSTLALWVTVKAFESLSYNLKGIIGVTMPGFGTTDRTYQNALRLTSELGITLREIPISEAVLGHFKDISHDPLIQDVTYENAQARERTQILMDLANKHHGLVIGTGDLSELALGWATYNGDHMSMYAVNCSIPKTLVRHLIQYAAENSGDHLKKVMKDILNTPVSPELLPPGDGEIAQKTESIVGPYLLHDFFLYYLVRYGFSPAKIERLAKYAFHGLFTAEEIHHWLKIFIKRFFAQQFKRSCLPDGPKVGSVTLSPRGDWRMPSDAEAALWLQDLE